MGGDESGIGDSEAQEFLLLEQQTASEMNLGERDDISGVSTGSLKYSALRASCTSQSGATKGSVIKPTKQPAASLLGKYNANLARHATTKP